MIFIHLIHEPKDFEMNKLVYIFFFFRIERKDEKKNLQIIQNDA